jgi:drug/metabolite transporter (DMT)-like permease
MEDAGFRGQGKKHDALSLPLVSCIPHPFPLNPLAAWKNTMYRRKPQVIWIDGTRCAIGLVTGVCSALLFAAAYAFTELGYGPPLYMLAVFFAALSAVFLYMAWRRGRERKAAYDNRPNKVLPRGATSNADINY